MVINVTRQGVIYEEINGDVVKKECTVCKQLLDLSNYRKDIRGFQGKHPKCKTCHSTIGNAYKREYRRKHPEKVSEWNKKSYREKPEYYKRYAKKYRESNPDKVKKNSKLYYEQNKERIKESVRVWDENNPFHVIAYTHNGRARRLNLPATLKGEEIEALRWVFAECPLSNSQEIEVDHFVPLSVGGPGSVINNMIYINPLLNASKGSKNPFEWFRQNKERLNMDEAGFIKTVEYLAEMNNMTAEDYEKYVHQCFVEYEEGVMQQ